MIKFNYIDRIFLCIDYYLRCINLNKKLYLVFLLILLALTIISAQDINEVDFYQMLLNETDDDIRIFEFEKDQLFKNIDVLKKSANYNKKHEEDINEIINEFNKSNKAYFNLLDEKKRLISKIDKIKYNQSYKTLYDNEKYNSLSLEYYNLSKELSVYRKDMFTDKKSAEKYKELSDKLAIIMDALEEIEYKLLPLEYSKYDLKNKIIRYLNFEKTFYDKKSKILEKLNKLIFKVIKIENQIKNKKDFPKNSI